MHKSAPARIGTARGMADTPGGADVAKATCSIRDCEDPVVARGWCNAHYKRWRRHGDPLGGETPRGGTVEERLWARVEKTSTCWLWTGPKLPSGYGYLGRNGKHIYVHRLAYELLVGPIPAGLMLDHVKANGCTSKTCVKTIADKDGPAHLEPVTQRENILRGDGPAIARELMQNIHQRLRARTHCKRGHIFDEENALLERGRHRRCRKCRRLRERIYRQARSMA